MHMQEIRGRLAGAFTGYHGGAVFRLSNGQVWQQRRYKYKYKYKYRPQVRIYSDNGRRLMEFECMDESIEVVRANVLEEGTIVSDFNGFDGESRFEFASGRVWAQAEYKYCYHYAYRPHAMVVDGVDGTVLHVEGMNETVRVRRA
jgi:hypothetical protein